MIDVKLDQLLPRFLLNDKNGHALSKAIEAGARYAMCVMKQGVELLASVDDMPEWRLDELAWEFNSLYDFGADIETKRRWIREAAPTYSIYGTPAAIYQFLEGMFDEIEVEEWWQYGADPYHFQVILSGEWTDEKESWARRAVETAKNVRSICDDIGVGGRRNINISIETSYSIYHRLRAGMARTGQRPRQSIVMRTETPTLGVKSEAKGFVFPYRRCGTSRTGQKARL